jgi:hypothetical protein
MDGALHAKLFKRDCEVLAGGGGIPALDVLSGSVGQGGQNRPADVREVQERLNAVAPDAGGPFVLLVEDGVCGSATKAAILKFQKRYGELLKDDLVDSNKNTWKKLKALTDVDDGDEPVQAKGAVGAAKKGKKKKPPRDTPTVQSFLTGALHLTQFRIIAAIQSLDQAKTELTQVQAFQVINAALKPMTLHQAYLARKSTLVELPEVDRCFHVTGANMTVGGVEDSLRRLRKVFSDMMDVIVATIISSPAAEASDVKRFVRTAPDISFKRMYPPDGAVANAPQGGWWKKDANKAHILVNASTFKQPDIITTLLHEMSHFVSHISSYQIGDHHKTGLYQGAFNDTHDQAVKNSFCYEWFAMLALFKQMRTTPNVSMPGPI